jgi:predicted site-specific integrase-resolvase
MNKPVQISTAATALGVSTSTLRRWGITGKLKPARTEGGQSRYDLSDLLPGQLRGRTPTRKSIAYARVSSHDQKADLERQKQVLELYCAS